MTVTRQNVKETDGETSNEIHIERVKIEHSTPDIELDSKPETTEAPVDETPQVCLGTVRYLGNKSRYKQHISSMVSYGKCSLIL